MVVGGGISGMQAALDLADSGLKVYLVDSKSSIGGAMVQLDKTFPTMDCAMCTIAPRLVDISRHLNIEVITNAEVDKVSGSAGNFQVTLKKRARYIDVAKCTGCSACIEKCPIKVDSEYDLGLIKRTAIHRRYPQAVPSAFTIDKQGVSPCRLGCPAGVNPHAYVALIAQGRFAEALAVQRRENPFPGICGRICPHPCEAECQRGELDEPISIAALKRFLADWEIANPDKKPLLPETLKTRKEKVAIIGSGPAGLSCAHYLAVRGYNVTIFEALPVAGGMLRVGVPAYRLPREIIDQEIQSAVLDLGVEIKLDTPVTSLDELRNKGYDAIFIAVGAHRGLKLDIPGENSEGVIDAVVFLRDVNLGKDVKLAGKRVVVIGGGNTAVDAARSALRLGAREVIIAYRRSRAEMPASPWEVEEAEQEGVKIQYLVAPVEILTKDGKVEQIKLVRMQLGEPDASGRRRPIPINGSEFVIPADIVIAAIGQQPDLSLLPLAPNMRVTEQGTIEVDSITLQTAVPYVFAGGDAVSGPARAIDAIEAGKRAAESIDRYLRGEDLRAGREKKEPERAQVELKGLEKKKRVTAPLLPVRERIRNFNEVQGGLTPEQAIEEAKRCLACAICSECLLCVEACEAKAINHEVDKEEFVTISVGAIIIAPGFELFDLHLKPDLGFGLYPNVISSLQFERLLSPTGPTGGKIQRLSDSKPPKSLAFIQCVGSRDFERDYCSAVCCMYATKEAILAKEYLGEELRCDIFYMDMRAFSKGFEEYYSRAKSLGVNYIRCRPPTITEVPETRNLKIEYLTEDDRKRCEEYEMVVLSAGLVSPRCAGEIAEKFGLELNKYGFCVTNPFTPVSSPKEGIFVAGAFTGPKDIPESVMQGCAAAARSLSLLSTERGKLVKEKVYPPERDVRGEEPRVGVFICHCGKNIGGVIDVADVAEYAKTLPNVVCAEHFLYTCSTDSGERIKQLVREHNLNRVVVAACTPRTHEPLFQSVVREAGLNPYLFEMANIRDQCTWVHTSEPEAALLKAKDLVRMSVARARLLEPLPRKKVKINRDALVIGGGVAGVVSALELADQGFETYLIERSDALGGNLRRVKLLLNGDNPEERLRSLISRAQHHPKIHIYTNSQILNIEGSVGNFTTEFKYNGAVHSLKHGVVIVATGGQEYKPTEYLYGEDKRVITQLELEEKLANGEFLKSKPGTVVMIQCVGSRNGTRLYCSRICCPQAIKNALKIKELSPETHVFVLYRDMRTYGFNESYYTEAREKDVRFVVYDGDKTPEVARFDGQLKVTVYDPVLDADINLKADLVVLSTGVIPRDDAKELAQKLKVPLTSDGFFLEAHMKLRPVDFATDGVFLCGLAHFPKTVDESIAQASAAASRASTIISKDEIEIEAAISQVIDENCDGCAYCIDPCPFKAITLIEYVKNGTIKKTVEVDELKCKGCGTCQATCPKRGIFVKHFSLDQIMAMVEAAV